MKRHAILTPEHVLVELPPAGLGSRFVALTVDGAIIVGASSVLGTILTILLPKAIAAAATATLSFLLTWSYHVFFEVRHQGRSPGKRLVGIRVVDGHGLPITLQQSFLRNAARALDRIPFAYGLGALVCRLHPQNQRWGDMLADTLVIRDAREVVLDRRAARDRTFNSLRTPRVLGLARRKIGLAEREFLTRLVERSIELEERARFDLMQEVGRHYREVLGIDDPRLSGENLVRALASVLASRPRTLGTPSSPR